MTVSNIISVISICASVLTTVMVALIRKGNAAKDRKTEQRAEARKTESLLLMEVMSANADLTYAVACAVKRGTPNGEIEEGIAAYNRAKQKYYEFLREQTTEHIN